jgi:UDP-N-acetylmuramyl pentapeptide phosphotransferase/UDP-N-acetylglucosamine-1-phosphate transferase
VHNKPIPRLGGVTFLPIILIVFSTIIVLAIRYSLFKDSISDHADDMQITFLHRIWDESHVGHFVGFIAGSLMLYFIGLYDDIVGLSYKYKFIAQIMAGILLCISGLWIANLGNVFYISNMAWYIGMPFTILVIVYITNALNLIDGIDGLAAGLSSISLLVIAAVSIWTAQWPWALLATISLGVTCTFFYFNVFNKRMKIFMGDAGSLTLGFLLSFLTLHFWQKDPVWHPILHNVGIIVISSLLIPLMDVVRVFASRIRDGRNPFMPDKNHIHHKLLRTGLKARGTMLTILFLTFLIVAMNYAVASWMSQTLMIIADILLFILMHIVINIFIIKKEGKGFQWKREL